MDSSYFEKGREQGRIEGRLTTIEDRYTHLDIILERIDARLARIEKRESELTGAWWVFGFIATLISAGMAILTSHFWK